MTDPITTIREAQDALRKSARDWFEDSPQSGAYELYMRADALDAVVAELEASNRVLWGVVANAGRRSGERVARWSHVVEATGLGSTSAAQLCRRFGFDPDEEIGDAARAKEAGDARP